MSATPTISLDLPEAPEHVPGLLDFGYRRSPVDHRDYLYAERVLAADPAAAKRAPKSYRVDKRSPLTAYTQAGPSCTGWAGATLKTVQERKDQRRTLSFDGQRLYAPIALPGGGAYIRDLLEQMRTVGVHDVNGDVYRIAGYAGVNPRDHDAVRHAIATHRGVLIGFMVTKQWAAGGGAEFTDGPGDDLGGHAMYLPGYDPDGPDGLNTWGPGWSGDGRAKLPWAYWDRNVWECWTVLDEDD